MLNFIKLWWEIQTKCNNLSWFWSDIGSQPTNGLRGCGCLLQQTDPGHCMPLGWRRHQGNNISAGCTVFIKQQQEQCKFAIKSCRGQWWVISCSSLLLNHQRNQRRARPGYLRKERKTRTRWWGRGSCCDGGCREFWTSRQMPKKNTLKC